MSLAQPDVPGAFAKVVAAGATRVLVLPYFLHLGVHLRADIPRLLQETCAAYPHLQVILGPHLGYDEILVELLAKRIRESHGSADVRSLPVLDEPAAEPPRKARGHVAGRRSRKEQHP